MVKNGHEGTKIETRHVIVVPNKRRATDRVLLFCFLFFSAEKLVSVLPTIEENRQYGQVRQKRNRGGDKSNGGGAGVASSSSSSSSSSASSASSLPSSSAASSAAPVPSPRKMRPSPPTADADAWAAASASASLPFPTKEDFASFFDAYSPAYPFRFLFGIDDDQQQTTGPCTA